MRPLPRGTVTLVFTDIEGSTQLLREVGERYVEVLADHRRVVRDAFARHGGIEVDTQGDAFFYVFSSAHGALAAAHEAQAALTDSSVRVRMGIHTGEPAVTDEGYVGLDVHRAARVMAAARGGQVLVSGATRAIVDQEFDLRDLGSHRLKDLTAPEHLYQLGDGEFPPPRSLRRTNLQVPPDALLGREHELGELAELLTRGQRVTTITGPGGSGKTRLAIEAARSALDRYPDGVFWVPLAGIADPQLVLPSIRQALETNEEVASFLAGRSLLLLLDNFEHLLPAAEPLATLLAGSPRVQVLVTSRSPLHIAGEREYPLDPLSPPAASALFVQRAAEAGREVEQDETVAEICRRLDRLPLAIELAAARAKLLPPAAMLKRLERALPLLTGSRRDAPERQRTLRATIDWSYALLDEERRRFLARHSVFAGGWTLEAAEQVCGTDLDSLALFVDASLVRPMDGERFTMLETVREYAAERLDESGEAPSVRDGHLRFFVDVAKAANLAEDSGGPEHHDLARAEADNLRAALEWAIAADQIELGLEIVVALELFWVTTGPAEGLQWLETLMPRPDDIPLRLRARALRLKGGLSDRLGRPDDAQELYEQSRAAFEELGDEVEAGHILHRLAWSAFNRRQFARAKELGEEALALDRRRGNRRRDEAIALALLGDLARVDGDDEAAIPLLAESVQAARDAGFSWWEANTLVGLAGAEWRAGILDDAERHSLEALNISAGLGDRSGLLGGLASLARIAAAGGRRERAGLLWGAVEAEEQRYGTRWAFDRAAWERAVAGEGEPGEEFERARAEGRALGLEDAVERVRSGA